MSVVFTATTFLTFAWAAYQLGRRLTSLPVVAMANDGGVRRAQAPLFGPFTIPLAQAIPTSEEKYRKLTKDVLICGDHRRFAVDQFLAKRNVGMFATILIGLAAFACGAADGYEWIVLITTSVIFLLVYTLPRLVLSGKASNRAREIESAIPDAMDMVALSIQGGQPLLSSIGQVASRLREISPALADELLIVGRQAEAGSIEHAFENFATRIEISDIAAWCSVMQQCHKLGGGLAVQLFEHAERIRIDRLNRIERSGSTASLKLLLPVVLCLAPPIAVILIGPAVIELTDFINREKSATQAAFENVRS